MSKEMEVTEWTSFAGDFLPERCLMFPPITNLQGFTLKLTYFLSMENCVETKCATKVSFFLWTVAWGKIITIENL